MYPPVRVGVHQAERKGPASLFGERAHGSLLGAVAYQRDQKERLEAICSRASWSA